ncbi:MAG: trypsin-like peptidase domain-containing protein [Planctomycetia bacterium]|nr:trypsin-like peptidase domain-containing protein [Planctomycetia bacterium]
MVQRTREFFADRLDDVLHIVRQDRQELRGWEEPAHLRAVVRRTLQEGANGAPEEGESSVTVAEFGRTAGEPDRGQQREALGVLLEHGAAALEKTIQTQNPDLTPTEILGLECVLLFYARPSVLVSSGRLAAVPPVWNLLEDQREDIELVQSGVGRLEMYGHPDLDWAGTGFLVSETALLTTRRTAEFFIEQRGEQQWQFRPGITAWMNYRSQYQQVATAGYQVRGVIGVHDRYDLALLEVEPPQPNGGAPTPLALAAQAPANLEGRPVYLVGYPVRDARRNEPEKLSRVFRDVYNVKRVQPGVLRGSFQFRDVQLLRHDCAMLGQSAGGALLDLETHQVLGIQLSGRYLEPGTAIPLWALRDDPLLRRANVSFAEASSEQMSQLTNQLERLSRSRYWSELQSTINSYYRRAFGPGNSDNR